MQNSGNKNDGQVYYFVGAKLNRNNIIKIRFSVFFGFIGIVVGLCSFGERLKYLTLGIAFCLSLFGYIYAGKKS